MTMLGNYFKSAIRQLLHQKIYSLLNVCGLAVGLTCSVLIFLWVEDELTFNHNFRNADYLYRVMQNEKGEGSITTSGSTPGPLAAAMKAEIPGVANSGRLSWDMDELAVIGDKSMKESGLYADPSFIGMLGLHFIFGNPAGALQQPRDIVISASMSRQLFGRANPVGQSILMNEKGPYTVDGPFEVKGVYEDLPANCSYHFQWLSPYQTWEDANPWLKPWDNNLSETIVQLSPAAHPAAVDRLLRDYMRTKVNGNANHCFLYSMNDWHLRDKFENGVMTGGSIRYVRLFSTIAAIILLLACINFMNLSTARSERRSKEVGVLKVLGAARGGLIGKFIAESLVMSFIAVILSVGLSLLVLPYYNVLVQKQLSLQLFRPVHLAALAGIGTFTGLIAGSYPAFYLSSFNAIRAIRKAGHATGGGAAFIRKGLVITQFAASIILIIATMVIYSQIRYIRDRDLGYSRANLIYTGLQGNMMNNYTAIKSDLLATGYVENTAVSLHDALHVYSYGEGFSWQGKDPNAKITIHSNVVSSQYLPTMHMKLVAGRDFYPGNTDSTNVIINESMAKVMGKAGRVGSIIKSGQFQCTIVGIMRDFVYNDVYGTGAPIVLFNGLYSATVLAIRYKQGVNLSDALAATGGVMKRDNPGYPFEYHFADADFEALFASETLIGKLAAIFAGLAIFISLLGLFGLAAYTAERRTREIGIRKVLGASSTGLAGLLAGDFMPLIAWSILISFPLSWWLMQNWLSDYAYRTTVHWWEFAAAGAFVLVIALVTVGYQGIRAALVNPVRSLRAE